MTGERRFLQAFRIIRSATSVVVRISLEIRQDINTDDNLEALRKADRIGTSTVERADMLDNARTNYVDLHGLMVENGNLTPTIALTGSHALTRLFWNGRFVLHFNA